MSPANQFGYLQCNQIDVGSKDLCDLLSGIIVIVDILQNLFYLIMTDEWFDNYMFRVVVEKKYVPADIMKMLEQKPIMLPSWDPMFAPEE